MPSIETRVDGLDDLRQAFARGQTAAPQEMDQAVENIAELILRGARQRVPRGPSGAAKASLRIIEGSGTAQLIGGDRKAPYYGWLDFGGRTGIRKSVSRPYRRSGRFIYPALVDQGRAITAALEDGAKAILQRSGLS